MKEFVMAALPWVLAGVAVAIICAGMNRKQSDDDEKAKEQRIAVGAAVGLIAGMLLNVCGLWESHALGFALGPLWGMALATLWDNSDKSEKNKE